jgi:hypothetical protein
MTAHACCMGQKIPETDTPRRKLRRMPRARWAALALGLVLLLGGTLAPTLLSPGRVIRGELTSAAADLQQSQGEPNAAALRRLSRNFHYRTATIDARHWPQVRVTLHGLPRDACIAAAREAGRIEGLVVVELERYGSGQQCAASNDMTWRFMP